MTWFHMVCVCVCVHIVFVCVCVFVCQDAIQKAISGGIPDDDDEVRWLVRSLVSRWVGTVWLCRQLVGRSVGGLRERYTAI